MSFGVVWKPAAEEDINAIAAQYPIAASQILDFIDRLAENPVALAMKPSFPHPLYPKYQFWMKDVDDGHHLYVTVLFSYLPGEGIRVPHSGQVALVLAVKVVCALVQ